MEYPVYQAQANPTASVSAFGGLNRTQFYSPGEFSKTQNLSARSFPVLAPRLPREEIPIPKEIGCIQAFIAPKHEEGDIGGFTGVADGFFYYRNEKIPFEDEAQESLGGEVSLADFNGKIIIAPHMLYFDYTDLSDPKVRPMTQGITSPVSVRVYSSEDTYGDYTNRIYSTEISWSDYFSSGDSICLEGFTDALELNNTQSIDSRFTSAEEQRPVSVIVDSINGSELYVRLYDKNGNPLAFRKNRTGFVSGTTVSLRIYTSIPTMNSICVHNNRLWGTNPNGEFIYASRLGDPFCFTCFEGLATDSWYTEIGTRGGFLGIAPFRDNLVAFKRGSIHHVYGDKPANYSVPKQLENCGCIDIRSVCQIGTALYYLSDQGFCTYAGGQPQPIGEMLGRQYQHATAVTDGVRYYVSAQTAAETEFLCYDTRNGVWLREDDLSIAGGTVWNGDLYAVTQKNQMFRFGSGMEAVSWYAETVPLTENTLTEKGILDLYIRAKLSKGASLSVYTQTEDRGFRFWRQYDRPGVLSFRVPVRFQKGDHARIRLEGQGDCALLNIERRLYAGGRVR